MPNRVDWGKETESIRKTVAPNARLLFKFGERIGIGAYGYQHTQYYLKL